MNELDHNKLITQIESLLDKARNQVAVQVNNTLLVTYMEIGRLIVEDMMEHQDDENYKSYYHHYFQRSYKQVWKRIFSCKYLEYDGFL